ncbi:hypothetical protein QJS04_geneDACA010495 [Acorus gramineus]|uniref:Fanconi Anaemia group E protein C-terminal domain-containing protein n=1 Tax=Acorus gramineus TaxID=55184 RepID=A0AAV9AJX6_ACOGR|nr:hypothetical protein QJS04_geneDACA010495 [Acorus gramineus]
MDCWTSLLNIFLKSPCPEREASLWFQTQPTTNHSSFLSHLSQPTSLSSYHHNPNNPNTPKTITIRFCHRRLRCLAIHILNRTGLDFWVNRAAHDLLESISTSASSTPQELDQSVKQFDALPQWLRIATPPFLPWLPLSGDPLDVLDLVEVWEADDEIASVLLSRLSDLNVECAAWPTRVLCSVVLPKLLVLERPASRVLATAVIDYCKMYRVAAVDGLLFPLLHRKGGINNPLCDLIARIIKECAHVAHVSAFCQELLCIKRSVFSCLPRHRDLILDELVWNEHLCVFFQHVLNLGVRLTPDSVDCVVSRIDRLSSELPWSVKFGNFLLCLVTKCAAALLKKHKVLLMRAAERTDTFVTKSIISKLNGLRP